MSQNKKLIILSISGIIVLAAAVVLALKYINAKKQAEVPVAAEPVAAPAVEEPKAEAAK